MAGVKCASAQAYFPPWKPVNCSGAELAKIQAYGAGWMEDFAGMLAAPTVATFLTACVAHEERGTPGWTSLVAGGTVLRSAFASWHRSVDPQLPQHRHRHSRRRQWIDDCPLPCNANPQVCAPVQDQ